MLAGCIPVTTRAGALPEVVGEIGAQVEGQDPRSSRPRSHGPSRPAPASAAARERVLRNFPLEIRREGVQALVTETLTGPPKGARR